MSVCLHGNSGPVKTAFSVCFLLLHPLGQRRHKSKGRPSGERGDRRVSEDGEGPSTGGPQRLQSP